MTLNKKIKHGLFYLLLILISALFAYFCSEVYYRIELRNKIKDRVNGACMWIQNKELVYDERIDDVLGYANNMRPPGLFRVKDTIEISVVHPTRGTLNFSVRTNNVGLLSDLDYNFERDPLKLEYRIVMLGDSLTGPTTSTYQWVDTLEEILNANKELKEKLKVKEIKVYNLGWVAAGFNTFENAYKKMGRLFDPDLVVVNYVDVDFPRGEWHFKTEEEMVGNASRRLEYIRNDSRSMLVTLMPTYNNIAPPIPDPDDHLTRQLMKFNPKIKVEIMKNRLPVHLGVPEIETWYNLPHDAHLSDKGGELYARAMAGVIAEKISGLKIDFTNSKSKYSDYFSDPNARPTRKISTSLSRLADNPEKIKELKDRWQSKMIMGKVFMTTYPYIWHMVFKTGSDGVTPPYTRKLKAHFIKERFGASEDDFVLLNVVTASGEPDLGNPECYTHLHMFSPKSWSNDFRKASSTAK